MIYMMKLLEIFLFKYRLHRFITFRSQRRSFVFARRKEATTKQSVGTIRILRKPQFFKFDLKIK